MVYNILTLAPAAIAVAALGSFVALALYQFARDVAPYVLRLWSWLTTPHTYGAEEAGDDSGVTLTGWQLLGVSLLTVALSLALCIDYDALLNMLFI